MIKCRMSQENKPAWPWRWPAVHWARQCWQDQPGWLDPAGRPCPSVSQVTYDTPLATHWWHPTRLLRAPQSERTPHLSYCLLHCIVCGKNSKTKHKVHKLDCQAPPSRLNGACSSHRACCNIYINDILTNRIHYCPLTQTLIFSF